MEMKGMMESDDREPWKTWKIWESSDQFFPIME